MKRLILLAVVPLLFSSCAKNIFLLDKTANVKNVGVHLQFGENVPEEVQTALRENLESFVAEYNAEAHRLKAFQSDQPQNSSITIYVHETKLVKKGQQVTGALVTVAGLSLPFVMIASGAEFAIFFYYFPPGRISQWHCNFQ